MPRRFYWRRSDGSLFPNQIPGYGPTPNVMLRAALAEQRGRLARNEHEAARINRNINEIETDARNRHDALGGGQYTNEAARPARNRNYNMRLDPNDYEAARAGPNINDTPRPARYRNDNVRLDPNDYEAARPARNRNDNMRLDPNDYEAARPGPNRNEALRLAPNDNRTATPAPKENEDKKPSPKENEAKKPATTNDNEAISIEIIEFDDSFVGHLQRPTVKVIAGKAAQNSLRTNKAIFRLHKNLLCEVSTYFRDALRGSSSSAIEKVIEVEEFSENFAIFALWLYKRDLTLVVPKSQQQTENPTAVTRESLPTPYKRRMNLEFHQIVKLYILANRRGVPALQDAAVNAWRQRIVETGAWDIAARYIDQVYDSTPASCKLRKFLVDAFASQADSSAYLNTTSIPKEFLAAVLKGSMIRNQRTPQRGPMQINVPNYAMSRLSFKERNLCEYHEHPRVDKCNLE